MSNILYDIVPPVNEGGTMPHRSRHVMRTLLQLRRIETILHECELAAILDACLLPEMCGEVSGLV